MVVEKVLAQIVQGLVKEIVVGFLEFSQSSGKTCHTVSYCFSVSVMK